MSVRPSSQKKSSFPLKPGLFRCDQPSSVTNREFSSDESDCNNVAFHRPKCPWGRRRSYIQKVKKTAFFDYSVTCIPGRSQSPVTKKPWLNSSVSSKNNDFWQRPLGKKKGGVHCFCTRQEQAKITAPSRKLCSPDWIEARRNHIVNKFDGFSKNILKITGKLSEETISMITAKIKENSEKNSDFNLQNIYNSSTKGVKRFPSNKKDLIDNAMNHSESGKVVPVGEKYSSGYKNNYHHSNELFTPSNNKLALARDSSILITEKESSTGNEILTVNRPASVNNKASNITERPTSVSSNTSNLTERPVSVSSNASYLTERPVSVGNKTSYLLKRPKSVGDKSLTNGKKPKSCGDKTSYIFQRPSSGGNKCLFLRERSVSFGENSYTGDNASTIERPISARDKTPQLSQRPWAGHKPSRFYARRVSIRNNSNLGDNASSNNDKPKSAGDKILQPFDSFTSENKILHSYAIEVPVGDNTFVDNNSTEIPISSSDKIPQPFLSLSPKNESSLFQEKSVLFGENICISDNALSGNENPLSASDESSQPILSLPPKIETSPLHEKYVSFGDNTYVGHDAIDINEKPLSDGKNTSNAIERFSTRNKLSHFHARTVSFSDNTVYFDKPLSAGDKSSLLDVSQESPDDKNLYFKERQTVAYQRKKLDRNSVSEVSEMKSSLDIVRCLQPSKHSLQISARRKILLERNVKKKSVQPKSNDYPTGYTVQLVKLKNYHRIEEDPKK